MALPVLKDYYEVSPESVEAWATRHPSRELFVHCPKLAEHVSCLGVCGDCEFFQGLVLIRLKRLVQKLESNEITEERFELELRKELQNPKGSAVVCTYPQILTTNSFVTGDSR